jgi:hypothetical protein
MFCARVVDAALCTLPINEHLLHLRGEVVGVNDGGVTLKNWRESEHRGQNRRGKISPNISRAP